MASDLEMRVLRLEAIVNSNRLAALEQAVAVVGQSGWQQWSNLDAGAGGSPVEGVCAGITGAGGIPAWSTGTAGQGDVTLYDIDPTTGAETAGATVTAFNHFPGPIAATTHVDVGRQLNTDGTEIWLVIAEFC